VSRIVVFLDTSVLVEVLGVPGKSQCPAEIQSQLRSRTEAGESMILPTATIIETGNHIAQLGNGDQRRRFAEAFARLLEGTVAGAAPLGPQRRAMGQQPAQRDLPRRARLPAAGGHGDTRRWGRRRLDPR